MTYEEMLKALETAKKFSETVNLPVYAMVNGKEVFFTASIATKEALELTGYWVASIFENGHEVNS
jgi:hypothetical protein